MNQKKNWINMWINSKTPPKCENIAYNFTYSETVLTCDENHEYALNEYRKEYFYNEKGKVEYGKEYWFHNESEVLFYITLESFEWIDVKNKLPDCWMQHRDIFSSGLLITKDSEDDFQINQYLKYGVHNENGWIKTEEKWNEANEYVTHWAYIPSI